MSTLLRKRLNPDQKTVNTIKIRKLENQNYQIEGRSDDSPGPEDDSYNLFDMAETSYGGYDQDETNSQEDDELVCTPSFDAFETIIQSQEEDDSDDQPYMNLPLEIKIESITSLNPSFDAPDQVYPPGMVSVLKDRDLFMESIYRPDEMPKGGVSPTSIRAMLNERHLRPLRHLAYIFAEDGNRYFPCHCCTSAFIKKYLLIKHYGAKHKGLFVCKLCASIFTSAMQKEFQDHMRAHNTRAPVQTKQCPLCLFWLSPRYFQGHLSIHNLLQKHFCRQCKQEFSSFYARAKHICRVPYN